MQDRRYLVSKQLVDSTDMPITMPSSPPTPYVTHNFNETDEEFLERQYQQSVCALERVHALSPVRIRLIGAHPGAF